MSRKGEDCTDYDSASAKFAQEFQDAVQQGDAGTLLKLKYFVEDLHRFGRPKLQAALLSLELLSKYDTLIEKLRTEFTKGIDVGHVVDVYSEIEDKWFEAKVLEADVKNDMIRVHYQGWDAKYDENLSMSQKRICPLNTFTKARRKAEKPLPQFTDDSINLANVPPLSVTEQAPGGSIPVEDPLSQRASRRRSRADGTPAEAAEAPSKRRSTEHGEGEEQGDKGEKEEKEEKDRNDWVCTICGWFEAPDGSDLVCCDGELHLSCACELLFEWLLYSTQRFLSRLTRWSVLRGVASFSVLQALVPSGLHGRPHDCPHWGRQVVLRRLRRGAAPVLHLQPARCGFRGTVEYLHCVRLTRGDRVSWRRTYTSARSRTAANTTTEPAWKRKPGSAAFSPRW
jgi:hypothetical protein